MLISLSLLEHRLQFGIFDVLPRMSRSAAAFIAPLCIALLGSACRGTMYQAVPELASRQMNYWVYVANESSDMVSRVRFGPAGIVEEETIPVGIMPSDLDGAHGMTVGPGGDYWYVSLAHGTPYGKVWKFSTGDDELVGSTTVGLFPATMAATPDGSMLFTVNFNLHGNPVPSSVSAIYTPAMQEIARIETCMKPHGGKVNHAGTHHYSACVASDQLVEISTSRLAVSRRLYLTEGHEQLLDTDDTGETLGSTSETNRRCKPTWVSISPDDRNLYVACNGRSEVLEIDAGTFEIARRFQTGRGPYNLDVSPNGQYLVASLKGNQAIAIFDLETGVETRIDSSQPITHGVVITPDSRYAFISNEAIGSTRGTIDVIDLASRELVATVEVQHQPGGISFWRMQEYTADEALP